MDKPVSDYIEKIVNENIDWFEMAVLACYAHHPKFRARAGRVLCIDMRSGKFAADFSSDVDNAAYQVLKVHRQMVGPTGPDLDQTFARAILNDIASQRHGIIAPGPEVDTAMSRLHTILTTPVDSAYPVVDKGFHFWLHKNRTVRITKDRTEGHNNWNSMEVQAEIAFQTGQIAAAEEKQTFFRFGHALDNQILDITRVSIPNLNKLTIALGGGLGKREATLIVAASGAGKTIMGTQLAASLATQRNQKVLYITTEQGREELEPRIISSQCNIAYDLIKDKFDIRLIPTEEKRQEYWKLRTALDPNLYWDEWNNDDHGRSVEIDLVDTLHRHQDEIGANFDIMFLDWIGGSLGKITAGDSDKMRHIYQITANKMASIAREENISTVTFAQADPTKGVDRINVDASVISECKGMAKEMTNGLGITALREPVKKGEEDNGDERAWSNKQFHYIFKSRKSEGGKIPFLRRYQYQQMVDIAFKGGP